ncbi:hypothetical protein C8R43DRAFT_1120036 [Mycena crocata]|nr:hypothetical protein C8R43DRAFT_1120036 [Mycena crocata]
MSHSPENTSPPLPPPRTPPKAQSRHDSPTNAPPPPASSVSDQVAPPAPSTPPRPSLGGNPGCSVTPRVPKVGTTALARSTHSESRREDDPAAKALWVEMLKENFAGVIPIDEFLEKFLPHPDAEAQKHIAEIVTTSASKLKGATKKLNQGTKEDDMSTPLVCVRFLHILHELIISAVKIEYLRTVVKKFPQGNKPLIADTHKSQFSAVDEGDHHTKPDVTLSRPGLKKPQQWRWHVAGTVIELKWETDIFDESGNINESAASKHALVQLAKSARSLLVASGSCSVFVTAVFARDQTRILRFDHTGFTASSVFHWTEQVDVFPTFFYLLYNGARPGRMYGQDDTISVPSKKEKHLAYLALCKNPLYTNIFTQEAATRHSLWITAVRFDIVDGRRVSNIVRCFTIGPELSHSDGLFSRATHVYRVLLEDEMKNDKPTVYALKDVWRQGCRRPETDFYAVIAQYCKTQGINMDDEGMAQCRGSIDLSLASHVTDAKLKWDPTIHKTCSTKSKDPKFERLHTRSLLTPVGRFLRTFSSTKELAEALHRAIMHHETAVKAGVLHRDVSEGNVLFEEVAQEGKSAKGFLVDYDYAEFTEKGLAAFNEMFPERAKADRLYENIEKSLKDITGTPQFMAIEVMKADANTTHGPHHDLESFYWLLVWMILRHTKHIHPDKARAYTYLFDATSKMGWIRYDSPLDQSTQYALWSLTEGLRLAVDAQNPTQSSGSKYARASKLELLQYDYMLAIFRDEIASPQWPDNDAALDFDLPSLDEAKNRVHDTKTATKNLRKDVLKRIAKSTSLKRSLDDDEDEEGAQTVASLDSEDTLAGSDGSRKKAKMEQPPAPPTVMDDRPIVRRSARRNGSA